MDWLILIVAGLFEVGFTTCMKLSEDFTKLWPSLGFLFFSIMSFVLLNRATRTIPLGTGYAVWTGIGACGTALIGILFYRDSVDFWRIFFLIGLIGCVLGLKFVSVE